ncbi:MAG: S8 family serine peptidase [Phycisphaerales bacterium]
MRWQNRRSAVVLIRAAVGVAVSMSAAARGADNGGAPNPISMAVPTFLNDGWGNTEFIIQTPGARTSAASRVNIDLADEAGNVPAPTPGYTITSTIVVELLDGKTITAGMANLIAKAGAASREHAGVPGYVLIDSGAADWTVLRASALARQLRTGGARMGVKGSYLDMRVPLSPRTLPTDPDFGMQWSLHNTVNPQFDVNAEPAWDAGYTGTGVTVGIVDQGFQTSHPEFLFAYNAAASQAGTEFDTHATECAGIVGMRANNSIGGAGIAYQSMLSKLYYGSSTTNATAFGFRNDLNLVKSNSWGPPDNGAISYMPGNERTAIQNAITNGRGGLGTIFVWAAGNGAGVFDRADYDPYVTSRFTIGIGGIYFDDTRSVYSESGSCILAAAQSDRDFGAGDMGIYTTTPGNGYTSGFGGTSAACPLAAGVVALMLQANPGLTWRDVQHVIVNTARWCDQANPAWTLNGAGHRVNYAYGFGSIDAGAATRMASQWRNVPAVQTYTSPTMTVSTAIPNNTTTGVSFTADVPTDLVVEHVEVNVTISHTNVGDLRIAVMSPRGTESIFALPRPDTTDNYSNYLFTTVRSWDERSSGTWTLTVADEQGAASGTITSWRLTVYGTTPYCAGDWNRDTFVNSQDFFDFLTALFSGAADFNRDGFTNSQDFFDFITAFFGGCE